MHRLAVVHLHGRKCHYVHTVHSAWRSRNLDGNARRSGTSMHEHPVASSHLPLGGLLMVGDLDLLCSLLQADMSHCIFAVENLGDLFERGSLCFWEHEVDPNSFDEVP